MPRRQGGLSGTGSSNFQLSGATLQTHAPLTAGSYGPFTVTATNAAILGSPFSLQVTVIAGSVTAGANFSVSGGKILDPNGVVAFGPVPIPVGVLAQIAQSPQAAPGPAAVGPHQGAPQVMSPAPADHGGAPARVKHRTVIGELSMMQLDQSVISIGRTPDNQIVVAHPQEACRIRTR